MARMSEMEEKGLGSAGMDEGLIQTTLTLMIEEWPRMTIESRIEVSKKYSEAFALSGLSIEEPPYVERTPESEDDEDEGRPSGMSPEEFARQESERYGRMYRSSYLSWAKREDFRQFSNRYLASIGGTLIEADTPETEEERQARRREESNAALVREFRKAWPRWSREYRIKFSGVYAEAFARSGLSLDDPYENS